MEYITGNNVIGVPTADHPLSASVSPTGDLQTRARGQRSRPISGRGVVARPLPIARQRHLRPVSGLLSGSASWQPQTSASLFCFPKYQSYLLLTTIGSSVQPPPSKSRFPLQCCYYYYDILWFPPLPPLYYYYYLFIYYAVTEYFVLLSLPFVI